MWAQDKNNLNGDTFSVEAPRKSSKNKRNMVRTFPLVWNFPFRVAANLLEHSSGAFIEQVAPFIPVCHERFCIGIATRSPST